MKKWYNLLICSVAVAGSSFAGKLTVSYDADDGVQAYAAQRLKQDFGRNPA